MRSVRAFQIQGPDLADEGWGRSCHSSVDFNLDQSLRGVESSISLELFPSTCPADLWQHSSPYPNPGLRIAAKHTASHPGQSSKTKSNTSAVLNHSVHFLWWRDPEPVLRLLCPSCVHFNPA